mmetsp:Transcript_18252/g.72983  ORF Transcript_18252/g.72983 Transcript_18252/m.72983 type:complete len:124 (-) Transcript_18252:41-412(-)
MARPPSAVLYFQHPLPLTSFQGICPLHLVCLSNFLCPVVWACRDEDPCFVESTDHGAARSTKAPLRRVSEPRGGGLVDAQKHLRLLSALLLSSSPRRSRVHMALRPFVSALFAPPDGPKAVPK